MNTENNELSKALKVVMDYTLSDRDYPLSESERDVMIAHYQRLRDLLFEDAAQKIFSIKDAAATPK